MPYSALFEVFGGYNANLSQKDNCFTIFNPITSEELKFYSKKWVKIIEKYLRYILISE